ncbi:hypothetical protein ACJRO7_003385 [Eucalyptus globulus]|uniref:AT-hook motif nuclear-localized protein n=1 Tax=Eucalyptus globulus TaxID=34317 RepID=A0ABD3IWL3_EUCGL
MENGGVAKLLGSQVTPQGSAGLGAAAGGDHGGADGGKPMSQAGAGRLGAGVAGAVVRKRRGRPRKYGLGRGALQSASSSRGLARRGLASRGRGRPRGPSGGILHVPPVVGGPAWEFAGNYDVQIVTIHRAEEILAKLSAFIEPGTHSLSVFSATGSVSSVVVRQPGPLGGLLTYEGCFEILALNGSFTIWEGRICMRPEVSLVNIMLARPDGQVFGGRVAGPLTAAGPTQIVVATFKDVVRNTPIRVEYTNPYASAVIGVSANPIHEVNQPEQIARMAEVDDNSGTLTSVLPEPTDEEAKTTITLGNNDVNPASLRIDEHYPLELVEPVLDRNMSTDTKANVPELR